MSETALRKFIRLINDHNVDGMVDLMTENHKFTDAVGGVVSGREPMRSGWIGYFKWFPDYKIEIKETYSLGNTFVVLGFASGTYAGRKPRSHWRIPAAWRAVTHRGRIKEWSVYCDTRIPQEIMEKNESRVGA
ncbi:MAG: nuclear transport factor 2 family protein [Nitrososphaerales archaeon]|nr:nuclear transport factor 2 family protein [Nitrososphaerales archaeon]